MIVASGFKKNMDTKTIVTFLKDYSVAVKGMPPTPCVRRYNPSTKKEDSSHCNSGYLAYLSGYLAYTASFLKGEVYDLVTRKGEFVFIKKGKGLAQIPLDVSIVELKQVSNTDKKPIDELIKPTPIETGGESTTQTETETTPTATPIAPENTKTTKAIKLLLVAAGLLIVYKIFIK